MPFCSMTRRLASRGLAEAAVGGMAQRFAAPAIRSPLAGAAGFAALATAEPVEASRAAEPVILGKAATVIARSKAGARYPPGSPIGTRPVCVDSKDNVYVFNRDAIL